MNEITETATPGGTGVSAIAGNATGFASGGIGTISRVGDKKKKKKKTEDQKKQK